MTDTEVDPYDGPPPDWADRDGDVRCVYASLDYHARRARHHQDELLRVEALYMAEMDRIRERYEMRRGIIQRKIDWHTAPIESFHRAHPDERTIELSHGTARLSVPKKPRVFVGRDADALEGLAEWARRSHPDLLKAPNVSDVRKVVSVTDDMKVVDSETGEVVPGCTAEIPEPSWSIDLAAGEPF